MSAGAEIAGRVALVTGATGFIGGALTRRLLAEGAQVHAVTRGDPLPVSPGMRWWRADLVDASALRQQCDDAKAFVRCGIPALSSLTQQSAPLWARYSGYLRSHGASLDVEIRQPNSPWSAPNYSSPFVIPDHDR